jgi:hypothetical protein
MYYVCRRSCLQINYVYYDWENALDYYKILIQSRIIIISYHLTDED